MNVQMLYFLGHTFILIKKLTLKSLLQLISSYEKAQKMLQLWLYTDYFSKAIILYVKGIKTEYM